MTNKYVNKKWCDENWSHDPAYLYEQKPKKFEKFVKYYAENNGLKYESKIEEDSSDEEKKHVKNKGGL